VTRCTMVQEIKFDKEQWGSKMRIETLY